jgi:hypothetical protein
VVTLDRSKLVAPVFAQAAAFAVVLVIGGLTHHGGTGPTPGPTHSASPRASSTTPTATKGQAAKLTVKVLQQGTPGLSVAGSAVKVLRNGTLTAVASGSLTTELDFAANVPAGDYQVCVKPPAGWTSTTRDTHPLHGFICLLTAVGSAPQAVTFQLTPPSTRAGA